MTTEQGLEHVTAAEARAFAEKIEAWARDLAPRERALLGALLIRAAADGGDIQGYWMRSDPSEPAVGGAGGGGGSGSTIAVIGGAAAASLVLSVVLPGVLPGLVAGTSAAGYIAANVAGHMANIRN